MSTYTQKVETIFSPEDAQTLDNQSKICNWLYNRLLETVEKDYKENNNANHYLSGYNLRNHIQELKETHPFLRTVHSTVIKEPAYRLKRAYEKHFDDPENVGFPHYRSWSKKWFSLVYDNPEAGWKADNLNIDITLGKTIEDDGNDGDCDSMKLSRTNTHITGRLVEKVELKPGEKIKIYTIVKQRGKYYSVFTIENAPTPEEEKFASDKKKYKEELGKYTAARAREKEQGIDIKDSKLNKPKKPKLVPAPLPKNPRWVSLDPNHKNFVVGYDYLHRSFEIPKLIEPVYWDKIIDELKSKRDKCTRTYKKVSAYGNPYTVCSKKWYRYDRAIRRCEHKREEQIKHDLYRIANELYRHYDLVLVGDYTPTVEVAPYRNMRRSMLNNTFIGQFRSTCAWVARKLGCHYRTVSEYHSTKACCVCGHLESKSPDVREFDCPECGSHIVRDVNGAVGIARNFGLDVSLSGADVVALGGVDRVWRVWSKDTFLPSLWPDEWDC